MIRNILPIVFLLWVYLPAKTQVCTAPGQTPTSAIHVCGSSTLIQGTPSFCGQSTVPGPCNNNQDVNPNFFRMSCFTSGTLGFTITPDDLATNYDWQLFDITNTNPFDIFSNSNLFVACNWSPVQGETGATIDGVNTAECSGSALPFSAMPSIVQGRTYLLMVSNKSGATGNYQLSFSDGSASITDPVPPQLVAVSLNCNATKMTVRLNKNIRCGSIAANGSDFTLSSGANIISASTTICNTQSLTDTITLTLDQPLANGTYTLTVGNGIDGNTLIDLCDFTVAVGSSILVVVGPPQPTLLDSIRPVGCKPSFIEMVFKRPIRCNSIAPDASDFLLTGPQTLNATVALSSCNNNTAISIIRLNLSSPLTTGGVYTVQLRNGTDGNTLIDECGMISPAGSGKSFSISSSVSAAFAYTVRPSCKTDTLDFFHDGANGVNSWNWKFDNETNIITTQNAVKGYNDTQPHSVRLIVSNDGCSDTSKQTIQMPGKMKADFFAPVGVCPGDMVTLINKSSGIITDWQWSMGNNMVSQFYNPPPYQYPVNNRIVTYTVRLVTLNTTSGCSDTIRKNIIAVDECYVLVPTAFSPNGDGLNDYLGLLNASKADKPDFKVYDRFGQLVFTSTATLAKWNGTYNGIRLNSGLFVWMLSYTHSDTGKRIFLKGTTMLVR